MGSEMCIRDRIYPEVDFADVCFTRHLLSRLWEVAPDRFAILREELQMAWLARMRSFLDAVGPRVVLLWFSPHLPSDAPWEGRESPLARDPLFVTRRMIDALRPKVRGIAMVQPTARAHARRDEGLIHAPQERGAAASALGPAAHREAAAALVGMIRATTPL